MKVSAVHKNARMAPRKIRPVATLVRGMNAQAAVDQLEFMPGKAPEILQAVIKSAMANAVHNNEMVEDSLRVVDAFVDEGTVMKRFQPASRGMAHSILKRSSHVTVMVDGEAKPKTAKKKVAKSDIATISAGEYVDQEAEQKQEDEAEHDHDHGKGEDGQTGSKRESEATEKHKKSNKQGGDKQKVHRRKSIG